MVRFKQLPLKENEGKLTYGDNIVDGIVLLAIAEIPKSILINSSFNFFSSCLGSE